MTTFKVMSREFETIEQAIEYANLVDCVEVAICYNGKIQSIHEVI